MKFIIKDNPISYNEIYQAIVSYQRDKDHPPSYMLIHPDTRRNILISSQDENNGLTIPVVHHTLHPEEGIRTIHKVFDLYLLQSEDIEPGFMIMCG